MKEAFLRIFLLKSRLWAVEINSTSLKIVIISDTHGLLNTHVLSSCCGSDRVIHAGDVGSTEIIVDLKSLVPVSVVRGNIDTVDTLPSHSELILKSWKIFIQHIVWGRGEPSKDIRSIVDSGGYEIVIFGHTHTPLCLLIEKTLYLNPGSCGPKRFKSDCTFAEILMDENKVHISFYKITSGTKMFLEKRFEKRNGKLYDCS